MTLPTPVCIGCHRTPAEIREFQVVAAEYAMHPNMFVREEEATYNPNNGHFCCTDCYIRMGSPSTTYGWRAP